MKLGLSRSVFWAVLLQGWLSGMAVAQDFPGLREAMTAEERKAAGLDNLTAEQQEFLDAWLRPRLASPSTSGVAGRTATQEGVSGVIPRDHPKTDGDNSAMGEAANTDEDIEAEIERRVALEVSAVIAKAAEEAAAEEAAEAAARDEPFDAEIVGPFSGWSGKTVFTLSNGQVWRQRSGSNYRHTAQGQAVAVKKNLMGLWTLTVLSSGRTVGVYRID